MKLTKLFIIFLRNMKQKMSKSTGKSAYKKMEKKPMTMVKKTMVMKSGRKK